MTEELETLRALLIDDDRESLDLIQQSLQGEAFHGHWITFVPCSTFEEAEMLLQTQQFDLVATDVYRDHGDQPKTPERGDSAVQVVVQKIRQLRFCPVLVFSDGSKPEGLREGPLVKWADKTDQSEMVERIGELVGSGLPQIARRIHHDLDRYAGSYLWGFIEEHWDDLASAGATEPEVLERLVRRRASVQLGRLDVDESGPIERTTVGAAEHYLYPAIAKPVRLGEILRDKTDGDLRLVLTPHCDLEIRAGSDLPKTDFMLTAQVVPAGKVLERDPARNERQLRARLGAPPRVDRVPPAGRFRFLPGFLGIPDGFVDLLQLESVPLTGLEERFERLAVLDSPFAEAIQAAFVALYGRVGVADLELGRFAHLISESDSD